MSPHEWEGERGGLVGLNVLLLCAARWLAVHPVCTGWDHCSLHSTRQPLRAAGWLTVQITFSPMRSVWIRGPVA